MTELEELHDLEVALALDVLEPSEAEADGIFRPLHELSEIFDVDEHTINVILEFNGVQAYNDSLRAWFPVSEAFERRHAIPGDNDWDVLWSVDFIYTILSEVIYVPEIA